MRRRQCIYAALSTSSVSLRLTASPHRGSLGVRRSKASPSRGGGSAERRDGGIAPRKKVQSIWISTASPIDGSRSTATSYKSDTPVSGGAYQNIREVTTEWNDN